MHPFTHPRVFECDKRFKETLRLSFHNVEMFHDNSKIVDIFHMQKGSPIVEFHIFCSRVDDCPQWAKAEDFGICDGPFKWTTFAENGVFDGYTGMSGNEDCQIQLEFDGFGTYTWKMKQYLTNPDKTTESLVKNDRKSCPIGENTRGWWKSVATNFYIYNPSPVLLGKSWRKE